MKRRPREDIRSQARRVRAITRGTETRFIVNDDVDLAREVEADGVHLGQGDLPLPEARARWPESGRLFGLSTHNESQERTSRALAPDYIGVGPVFATPTKDIPDPTLGVARMGAIIRGTPLTAVAIGGIHAGNLPDVLAHGAVNFAVVRAVNQSPDPAATIRNLHVIWLRHAAEAPNARRKSADALEQTTEPTPAGDAVTRAPEE
jgi:thiamine-phosphate pyrophosphorylase